MGPQIIGTDLGPAGCNPRHQLHLQSLLTFWAFALIWSCLRFLTGGDGEVPMLVSVFFIFSWIAVAESYSSRAILKMMERNSGQPETLDSETNF